LTGSGKKRIVENMASSWIRAVGLAAAGVIAVAAATVSGSASADAPATSPGVSVVANDATTSTVRVGPFFLPPASSDGTPGAGVPIVNQFVPNLPKPCESCFVTAVEPNLVDPAGNRADMNSGVMLHHAVIAETGKEDVTCGRNGIGAIGRRLFASGDERTAIAMPAGFGYRVDPGPWVGLFELMNMGTTPQVVFFQAVVHHVPASTPDMKPITPVWLDEDNCYTSVYSVPKGKSATPWSWTSTLTGRIVAAGGHVHAGGIGLTLDNATTNQRICGSSAAYGSGAMAGHVTSMSTCSWDSLGALRSGDKLTLTSLYDSPEPQNDVMGIMLIAVYETDQVNGGTKAPASMRKTPSTKVPGSVESGHHMDLGGDNGHDMGDMDHGGGNPPH
jgi:hypothetical protein